MTLKDVYELFVQRLPAFDEKYTPYAINLDGSINGLVLLEGAAKWMIESMQYSDSAEWNSARELLVRVLSDLAKPEQGAFEFSAVGDFLGTLSEDVVAMRDFLDRPDLSDDLRAYASSVLQ